MRRLLTPNRITVLRVLLAGVAVGMYGFGSRCNAAVTGIVGFALTVGAIALDGLDGFLARRMNLETDFGAQLDILGDRVIENLFFIYFAVCGEISVLVPVIFFLRGALTDFLRGVTAARGGMDGQTTNAFRGNWMLRERWSSYVVAGRASRGTYAALKCVCFCALGLQWTLLHAHGLMSAGIVSGLGIAVNRIVSATVVFCIARAVPVFWEGARDLLTPTPAQQATKRAHARPMVIAR